MGLARLFVWIWFWFEDPGCPSGCLSLSLLTGFTLEDESMPKGVLPPISCSEGFIPSAFPADVVADLC